MVKVDNTGNTGLKVYRLAKTLIEELPIYQLQIITWKLNKNLEEEDPISAKDTIKQLKKHMEEVAKIRKPYIGKDRGDYQVAKMLIEESRKTILLIYTQWLRVRLEKGMLIYNVVTLRLQPTEDLNGAMEEVAKIPGGKKLKEYIDAVILIEKSYKILLRYYMNQLRVYLENGFLIYAENTIKKLKGAMEVAKIPGGKKLKEHREAEKLIEESRKPLLKKWMDKLNKNFEE
jgi:hypothetical protein